MDLSALRPDNATVTARRRAALGRALNHAPAVIASGWAPSRNFAAWHYPFRASSHFLYLTGLNLPGAFVVVRDPDTTTLYVEPPAADDALWHGETPGLEALSARVGCRVRSVEALEADLRGEAPMTLPTVDPRACAFLERLVGRPVALGALSDEDAPLADAMIDLRLRHDAAALDSLRVAASATVAAFDAGMRATRPGDRAWVVRAAMEHALGAQGMVPAYEPIVSTRGEVLHNRSSAERMGAGGLLLVDFGAESRDGWACDVTRTWPVSGAWSPTQRDMYRCVLDAQRAALELVAPGMRFAELHRRTSVLLASGLVDLGILRGDPEELVADGVHALLFPHGLGHLLGLDVHDMEDLGDRVGYAAGRARSAQFGTGYLRLDRDLEPGMLVTIEPGLYRVPAILADPKLAEVAGDRLDREVLARFADVRGIRIEDDALVTDTGAEILTDAIPSSPDAVAARVGEAV